MLHQKGTEATYRRRSTEGTFSQGTHHDGKILDLRSKGRINLPVSAISKTAPTRFFRVKLLGMKGRLLFIVLQARSTTVIT